MSDKTKKNVTQKAKTKQVCANTEVHTQITYRTTQGKTLKSTHGPAVPTQSRPRHFPTRKQTQRGFSRGSRSTALRTNSAKWHPESVPLSVPFPGASPGEGGGCFCILPHWGNTQSDVSGRRETTFDNSKYSQKCPSSSDRMGTLLAHPSPLRPLLHRPPPSTTPSSPRSYTAYTVWCYCCPGVKVGARGRQ